MRTRIIPKSKAYAGGDFRISKITFSAVKSSPMLRYIRSMKQAHKKWHIVDPVNARTSRVFHSITTSRNYKKNKPLLETTDAANTARADSTKELKGIVDTKLRSQGMPPLGKGGDDGVLQIIYNHVKTPIKLYNDLYEEIKHF
jgi:hypothetical protein